MEMHAKKIANGTYKEKRTLLKPTENPFLLPYKNLKYSEKVFISKFKVKSLIDSGSSSLSQIENQENKNQSPNFSLNENERNINTSEILRGIGLATKYLSEKSTDQNKHLVSLLVSAKNEISQLREENIQARLNHKRDKENLSEQLLNISTELQMSRIKAEAKESAKQNLKEKQKKRKSRPLKDPFTKTDLVNVLKIIPDKYKDPNISARYCVCVCLLYLLGIRVNELRQIKIGHLENYLKGETLNIAIGKSKLRTKVEFPSSTGTRKFLEKHCNEALSHCFQNLKNNENLVPVSREHLTREMNGLIRNYGLTVNKHLLSHSCRVSFITRVCQTAGIEAARTMVGHAHIATTNVYNRNYLNNRARQRIMNDSLSDSSPSNQNISSDLEELLEDEST